MDLDLVELDRDHPGFRDAEYRRRRNEIAALARRHTIGAPVPRVEYTALEHGVWATALRELAPLHARLACGAYLARRPQMPFAPDRVPQLDEVNAVVAASTGFRLEPVAGLVSPATFMRHLEQGVFLATQYMRHHSAPLYTPEPDVIHELVGHAALLADPDFARVNRLFGAATRRASDEARVTELIRAYWYALEFGLAREQGRPRAVGAGLLSSFGELGRLEQARVLPFDLAQIARTPFDPTDYQHTLFVAPSVEAMLDALEVWLAHA